MVRKERPINKKALTKDKEDKLQLKIVPNCFNISKNCILTFLKKNEDTGRIGSMR